MRLFSVILALALLVGVLSGCGDSGNPVASAADAVGNAIGELLSGDVTGKTGKTYSTQWFSFNVESIEFVDQYLDYSPEEGNELIDVVITETGLFDEPVPMGTYDFYVDSDTFVEYVWGLSPLDDSMMPDNFELAKGESVTYHMVFEVPQGLDDLKLMYTEIDVSEQVGTTFTIFIER